MDTETFSMDTPYMVATDLESMENLKTQGIWKIVKISGKTQGNVNFFRRNLENSGKMKNMWHDHQQKCTPSNYRIFSLELLREKVKNILEISGETQGI